MPFSTSFSGVWVLPSWMERKMWTTKMSSLIPFFSELLYILHYIQKLKKTHHGMRAAERKLASNDWIDPPFFHISYYSHDIIGLCIMGGVGVVLQQPTHCEITPLPLCWAVLNLNQRPALNATNLSLWKREHANFEHTVIVIVTSLIVCVTIIAVLTLWNTSPPDFMVTEFSWWPDMIFGPLTLWVSKMITPTLLKAYLYQNLDNLVVF